MSNRYWVYILLCENNHYYTGYTTDLNRRYQEHCQGKASKYTRSFKPMALAQSWEISGDKSTAMRLERYIKTLTKQGKERLIAEPDKLLSDYQDILNEVCIR